MLGFFIPWIVKALIEPGEPPTQRLSAKEQIDRDLPDLSGVHWTQADEDQWQKDYGNKKA